MLNKEKFKDEILEIACSGNSIALDIRTNKPVNCYGLSCVNCGFRCVTGEKSCRFYCEKWCNSEYVEPEVDWSKVPVDTPILVRNTEDDIWTKRHFSKYTDEDGVKAWVDGATSWSADKSYICTSTWRYAKLANEEDISKYAK